MNRTTQFAKQLSIRFTALAVVATVGLISHAHAQSTWTVTTLHPSGPATRSSAEGAGAQQVGYINLGVQVTNAAVWSGTTNSFVNLHPAGATRSVAWGSGDGQQVGQASFANIAVPARAMLWTGSAGSAVDLHPAGWAISEARDAAGGQQVGFATFSSAFVSSAILWRGTAESFVILDPPNAGGASRALGTDGVQQVGTWTPGFGAGANAALWSGSAASHVDLEPPGVGVSEAFDVSRGQQVGYVQLPAPEPGGDRPDVASLWTGSAASWVNLNPAGASSSRATGVFNGFQVGFARTAMGERASLWRGTAASWVDLHAFVPPEFSSSTATDIAADGANLVISGFGFNTINNRTEALIWTALGPDCDTLDPAPVNTSVEFESIQAIFTGGPGQQARCTTCHSPSVSAGLSLAPENAFAALVNVDSSQDPTVKRVVPFSADSSLLFRKINCNNPGVGSRMPQGLPSLSLDEQRLIRDWINQGALQRQRVFVDGFEQGPN
jgi:hypothetical protein